MMLVGQVTEFLSWYSKATLWAKVVLWCWSIAALLLVTALARLTA